jgi:hypothetical protein
MKTILHAVNFSRQYFKNANETKKWLNKHNIKPIKPVDKTDNFFRYRINEVIPKKKFVSKYITDGIEFVFQLVSNNW